MAKHLPAYMAPIALRAITSALKFKGFGSPKFYRPLRAPFMAHEHYRQELRACMRSYITASIHAVTPFHVPKSTVVFPRHPRVSQALYNHKDALRQWAAGNAPTCQCELLQRFAPEAPKFGGHVAASGDQFQRHMSTLERQVLSGSSADTYFPSKPTMWSLFHDAWTSWCRANDLPGPPQQLQATFDIMWAAHHQAAASRYHCNLVDAIKVKTKGAIWHCEDHHPRSSICFCPVLYHTMLDGTFCNPSVFQEVKTGFESDLRTVQQAAKRALQRRYPWAFRRQTKVPTAYALPKRKKDFQAGRPIVSFIDAFMRPLLEATSRLLQRICAIAFPGSFARGDVYQLLQQLREFLEQAAEGPLHCRNQDLAGFFTSISKTQFMKAWSLTLAFYQQRHGPPTTFTVDVKERCQSMRVFRGRRRNRASRTVHIWAEDIGTIIFHALALQHFSVSGRRFKQAHGSPMGSPLSPALCSMMIAAQEEVWRRSFSITCSNMNRCMLVLRYVDNRLWLSEQRFAQLPAVKLFLNNRFYGGNILLEEEPAFDFVGFILDVDHRRIAYNRAIQARELPCIQSASPETVLLSGILARAHTIKKCAFPRAQALVDLRFLWNTAEERGLPIHSFNFKAKFWQVP